MRMNDVRRRIAGGLSAMALAGILATQFPSVRRAYEQAGLRLVAHRAENEWESGAFVWRQGDDCKTRPMPCSRRREEADFLGF